MSPPGRLRLLLPRQVRRLPADLAAALGYTVLVNLAVLAPVVRESPLRVILGLPFALFVPGYVFVAALFPEAGAGPSTAGDDEETDRAVDEETEGGRTDRGIDGIERVALSFGLSIAIVPLIGLALNFTPWGIRLAPIMVSLSGFVLLATGVAAVRRWALPADERFVVPYRAWVAAARAELFEPESRMDLALNVLLAVSVLLAVGSIAYAIAFPAQGEAFTEFYLLTEEEDGDLVADDYPTDLTAGENASLVVGVGNNEHERTNYTVVVALHRVEFEDGNRPANATGNVTNVTVTERAELRRFQPSLAHNETWHRPHEVSPTMVGEDLRLTYLLYRGEAPAAPTTENAYRDLHLWVNVTEE